VAGDPAGIVPADNISRAASAHEAAGQRHHSAVVVAHSDVGGKTVAQD
jgi:hypothetical protein